MKNKTIILSVAFLILGIATAHAEVETRKCKKKGQSFQITGQDTLHYGEPPYLEDSGEDGFIGYVCCDKNGNVLRTTSMKEVNRKCYSVGTPGTSWVLDGENQDSEDADEAPEA